MADYGTKESPSALAASTCDNFRLLAAALDLQIDVMSASNPQVVPPLRNARAAADRGIKLTEHLAHDLATKAPM